MSENERQAKNIAEKVRQYNSQECSDEDLIKYINSGQYYLGVNIFIERDEDCKFHRPDVDGGICGLQCLREEDYDTFQDFPDY